MKNAVEEIDTVSLTCIAENPSETCSRFTSGTATFLTIPVFPLGWELFLILISIEFNFLTTKWYNKNTLSSIQLQHNLQSLQIRALHQDEHHPVFMMPNTTIAAKSHWYLCRKWKGFGAKGKMMGSSEKYSSSWERRQGTCPAGVANGLLVHQVFPWMLRGKWVNKQWPLCACFSSGLSAVLLW